MIKVTKIVHYVTVMSNAEWAREWDSDNEVSGNTRLRFNIEDDNCIVTEEVKTEVVDRAVANGIKSQYRSEREAS